MGRQSSPTLFGKLRVQKMRLVDYAYDEGGAYWGYGVPLYVCQDEEGAQAFTRAPRRADALAHFKSLIE